MTNNESYISHIFHKKNAIPNKTCKELIDLFESNKSHHQLGPQNEWCRKHNKYFFSVISINLNNTNFIKDFILPNTDKYVKSNKYLSSLNVGIELEDIVNLQKYQPGHYYSLQHHETTRPETRSRALAWMIYLNDIKQGGGGTAFPQQDFITEPSAGDLYIWPADWTYSHYGLPAEKEEKYLINGWLKFAYPGEK